MPTRIPALLAILWLVLVGASLLVDAHDLNDAIRIASKIPPAKHGSIEVRPVRMLDLGEAVPGSGA